MHASRCFLPAAVGFGFGLGRPDSLKPEEDSLTLYLFLRLYSQPEKLSILSLSLAGMALVCTALTFELYAFIVGVTATGVLLMSSLWKDDTRTFVSGFMFATPLAWATAFMSAMNTWSRALMSHCQQRQEQDAGENSMVMGSDSDFHVNNLENDMDTTNTSTTNIIDNKNGDDWTNLTFFCEYKNLLVGSAAAAASLWVILGILTYRVSSQKRLLLLNDTDGGDTVAMDEEEDQSECMTEQRDMQLQQQP